MSSRPKTHCRHGRLCFYFLLNLFSSFAKVGRATLYASAHALDYNLRLLTDTLSSHAQFLKEAHAYPLPNFPGPSREGELGQLLRKKLDPGVENWIYEHTTKPQAGAQTNGAGQHDQGLKDKELRELWSWAPQTSNNIVVAMMEEDEGEADEGDDEDEDEADEVGGEGMEGIQPTAGLSAKEEDGIDLSQPPIPLESVLRFMTTGKLPSGGRPNR